MSYGAGGEQHKEILIADSTMNQGEVVSVGTNEGARRCGLAKTLSYLNLIDNDIYQGHGHDISKVAGFEDNPDLMRMAKERCKYIVHIANGANPKGGHGARIAWPM